MPTLDINAFDDKEMTTFGADPNQRCDIDLTPLSCAVKHASLPIVSLLLDRGGDVTKGQVLHHAVSRESDTIEVPKLLISRGAPINAIMYQDHQPSWDIYCFMGGTPLQRAVFLRKIDVIRHLLSEGANPNIRDVRNRTAAQCADEDIRMEIAQRPRY